MSCAMVYTYRCIEWIEYFQYYKSKKESNSAKTKFSNSLRNDPCEMLKDS